MLVSISVKFTVWLIYANIGFFEKQNIASPEKKTQESCLHPSLPITDHYLMATFLCPQAGRYGEEWLHCYSFFFLNAVLSKTVWVYVPLSYATWDSPLPTLPTHKHLSGVILDFSLPVMLLEPALPGLTEPTLSLSSWLLLSPLTGRLRLSKWSWSASSFSPAVNKVRD